jgi:hypothetical protein
MLDFLTGGPLRVGHKTYTLSPADVGITLAFRDWIAEREGDPFDGLDKIVALLPKEDAVPLIKEAKSIKDQLRCFDLQTPLAQKHIKTQVGATELMRLLLVEHHPQITDREIFQVLAALAKQMQKDQSKEANSQEPEGNLLARQGLAGL